MASIDAWFFYDDYLPGPIMSTLQLNSYNYSSTQKNKKESEKL